MGLDDPAEAEIKRLNGIIHALRTALRVARHHSHDQNGEPDNGFPVCSVCGAIQTADPPKSERKGYLCDICHRPIVTEAHGGPHPSPGDHDPAYHVAKAYKTGWTP